MTHYSPLSQLLAIMAQLRSKDNGCPWHKQQDFHTIMHYTLEECYEVKEAIEQGNYAHLCEELGDLLFQIVYHAQLAQEQHAFCFDDVVEKLIKKIKRRHPHIFGTQAEKEQGFDPQYWQKIKQQEQKANGKKKTKLGYLDRIPTRGPAVQQALALQNQAAHIGFEWTTLAPILEKLQEELSELQQAIKAQQPEEINSEFGDLYFILLNLARYLAIDPDQALQSCNEKFRTRFGFIEQTLHKQGKTLAQTSLQELELLWTAAKKYTNPALQHKKSKSAAAKPRQT